MMKPSIFEIQKLASKSEVVTWWQSAYSNTRPTAGCIYIYIIYDGFSKVLFPISAKNRNSLRDAFSFTCKQSYTEDTSKMQ